MKSRDTKPTCPECGGELIPVVYGYPSPSMMDAFHRGKIAVGCCCISDRDADLECQACERRFFSDELERE